MMVKHPEPIFWIFMALWIAATIAIFEVYLPRLKDVQLKKKLFPILVIGMSAAMALFLVWIGKKPSILYYLVPFIGAVDWVILKKTKF